MVLVRRARAAGRTAEYVGAHEREPMTERNDDEPLSSEEMIRRVREGYTERAERPAADPGTPRAGGTGDAADAASGPDDARRDPTERRWAGEGTDSPDPDAGRVDPAAYSDPRHRPPPPPPPADAGSMWPPAPAPPDADAPWEPPPPPPNAGRARWWSIARWVGGGLFLVALLGQCFARGTTLDDLAIGACFQDPGIGGEVSQVDTVDCNELHDFELFATVVLGDSARLFPGAETLFAEIEAECTARFPGYVGRDYLTSAYDFVSFTPVQDGWKDGDRTGMCARYEFDGTANVVRTIGTARNSGR